MPLDNMRLLRLGKAEYLIPADEAARFDELLKRRKPAVDYSIEPVPRPKDRFAAARESEIERSKSQMPYDDGDALPEGHYVVREDGDLERTGPAESAVAWHGTVAPKDDTFDLELRAPMADGREYLRAVPALYTTTEPLVAQDKALVKWRNERDEGRGDEQSSQIYEVVTTPSETVDAGDCKDEESVVEAIKLGADVVECPDWQTPGGKYVPEKIILNDDIHHTASAWQMDEVSDDDVSVAVSKAEQALRADRMVGSSIKRGRGMPRFTRQKALAPKPRSRRAKKHPFLRNGR